MTWKFKSGEKIEAKKTKCSVDELAKEINKVLQNPELSQKLATELLIKVYTEKKENIDEFKKKYSELGEEILDKIINIAQTVLNE